MNSPFKKISPIRLGILLATIATLCVAVMLGHVLYMLHRRADVPAVLWCGTTVTAPLTFTANILLPIGALCHIGCLTIILNKTHHMPIGAIMHTLFFALLGVVVILVGFNYCTTKLEGVSFTSLVWCL